MTPSRDQRLTTCATDHSGRPLDIVNESPTTATTSRGFTVTYTATRPSTPVRTGGTNASPTNTILPNVVSLCIQAEYGGSDEFQGPWSVSSGESVAKQNTSN